MTKNNIYLIIFLMIFAVSCNNNSIYKESKKVPNSIWDMNNILKFQANVEDVEQEYNIDIRIRHAEFYPSQNLWLFITTTAPDGVFQKDTLECILADQDYKWKGKGLGQIWDVKVPFKKDIKFIEKGEYLFEIQHGMRLEQLPQIMEIGVEINKLKK